VSLTSFKKKKKIGANPLKKINRLKRVGLGLKPYVPEIFLSKD
jgi:hypothetical protein